MRINYTWVRRLHLINNSHCFYLTFRIFGKRFHYSKIKDERKIS